MQCLEIHLTARNFEHYFSVLFCQAQAGEPSDWPAGPKKDSLSSARSASAIFYLKAPTKLH